jgi:hypothetical protein
MDSKLLRLDLEILFFFIISNWNPHDCKCSKKDTKSRGSKMRVTAARVRSRSLKALNVFQPIPVMQASAGHCQEEELGYSLVSSSLISTAL